ncbi:MAG TPA: hypothetical protein VK327_11495 [Candidatus Paceibacterota bacterium]|nr:hypothetical protein [Candidatus Paceibacterota bacterium]
MKLPWPKFDFAWQPFTFKGVAAFAFAPLRRLLVMQAIFAVLTALSIVWFLNHAWFPTIRQAILQMPEQGRIVSGRLEWENKPPQSLAEGAFLGVIADLDHTGQIRIPADIQVELGRADVRFISLFGYVDQPYPVDPGNPTIDFNRIQLEPWWGAWQPPILWMVFGGVFVGLMVMWWILAAVYSVPVWLVAFFSNRKLSLIGGWKLAGAALMPGAFLMILSIVSYGLGLFDLVQLVAIQVAHWGVGFVYCSGSLLRGIEISAPEIPSENPFHPEDKKTSSERVGENPFKPRGN